MGQEDVGRADGRAQRRAKARAAAFELSCMYRLDVHGADVADVVLSAGGWLFDRAMAGWQVNIDIGASKHDWRPMQILGLVTRPRTDDSLAVRRNAMAVAAHTLEGDDSLRRDVAKALRSGVEEVTVWGDIALLDRISMQCFGETRHHLSAAALAFKSHALTVAGLPADRLEAVSSICARVMARKASGKAGIENHRPCGRLPVREPVAVASEKG